VIFFFFAKIYEEMKKILERRKFEWNEKILERNENEKISRTEGAICVSYFITTSIVTLMSIVTLRIVVM